MELERCEVRENRDSRDGRIYGEVKWNWEEKAKLNGRRPRIKSETQTYRCAKDWRVPAASVCPFGCGVFCICWGFFLCFLGLLSCFPWWLGVREVSSWNLSNTLGVQSRLKCDLLGLLQLRVLRWCLDLTMFQPLLVVNFLSKGPVFSKVRNFCHEENYTYFFFFYF